MLWWLFRQILEFQKKILLDRKLCYRRSVCTYISIPTIYMYKVESIECIVWLSYQTPCWSVLEVGKFKLEKLSLTNWIFNLQKSISKLIFAGYTGSKNPVRNRLPIQFMGGIFCNTFQLIFRLASYKNLSIT